MFATQKSDYISIDLDYHRRHSNDMACAFMHTSYDGILSLCIKINNYRSVACDFIFNELFTPFHLH